MSKSYYQCLLFKQFTTENDKAFYYTGCQRAIINVYFSSNSQPRLMLPVMTMGCQRAIINVYFSSNSQHVLSPDAYGRRCQRAIINVYFSSNSQRRPSLLLLPTDVKELLSMSTFQAIHNLSRSASPSVHDVKELLSMSTFQAIHNPNANLKS